MGIKLSTKRITIPMAGIEDTILGLLRACGPSTFLEIAAELRTQSNDPAWTKPEGYTRRPDDDIGQDRYRLMYFQEAVLNDVLNKMVRHGDLEFGINDTDNVAWFDVRNEVTS
jgi:hypothetical protein